MSLQGKTALITGGTSGMGSATALAMAEEGASVIITGRDETRGTSTVEKIRAGGHDAQFIAAAGPPNTHGTCFYSRSQAPECKPPQKRPC